jgi:acyl dehydratase
MNLHRLPPQAVVDERERERRNSMWVFKTFDEVAEAAGQSLGVSGWLAIDQARVDTFAEATSDHQWIHVDVARAKAGPFGGTVAHGYLTLALAPSLGAQTFAFETPGAILNYGVNKVRFPTPVPVGSRIRAEVRLGEVTVVPAGLQVTIGYVIEIEHGAKPACVAETVVLLVGNEADDDG